MAYQPLEDALTVQARGLIAGGVDAILIETCQDPLQIKAAVNGVKVARAEAGTDTPIFVQVTVETTGTLLVGSDIAAAATVIHALDVPLIGLNCATGPAEMSEHVKWLAENWPGSDLRPAQRRPARTGRWPDPLSPAGRRVRELAGALRARRWPEPHRRLLRHQHPAYQAADAMLRRLAGPGRSARWSSAHALLDSLRRLLYSQVSLRQENAYLSIGERCNANGSKKWRELQEKHDWDGCVEMARDQVKEGSHTLDVCTAFVGRDEVAEMNEVITRFTGSVNAPLVIDSTEYAGAGAGAGAPWRQADHQLDQLRGRRGAGLQAPQARQEVRRRRDRADHRRRGHGEDRRKRSWRSPSGSTISRSKHGLAPEDLLFDPLTFTIATGSEDDRKLGQWTLEGIESA